MKYLYKDLVCINPEGDLELWTMTIDGLDIPLITVVCDLMPSFNPDKLHDVVWFVTGISDDHTPEFHGREVLGSL